MDAAVGTPMPPGVRIERWATEIPLRVVVVFLSLWIWFWLAISIIGIVYAAVIAFVLFTTHVALIAHVRGSAVRLRPDQFPELHRRVQEIASRAGMRRQPDAYLMQAGGALNAYATRFLGSNLLVLYSDLLEACGDDDAARDMVIAHEIGHLRCGHLTWRWLLFPGLAMPFLGSAYSRACEYTCDRYGAAFCGDPAGAIRGLAILSAGGHHARRVNLAALAEQRRDLDTGFMTLGTWLASHPPLSERIAALDPTLGAPSAPTGKGALQALGIIALLVAIPAVGGTFALVKFGEEFAKQVGRSRSNALPSNAAQPRPAVRQPLPEREVPFARKQVAEDFEALAAVAEAFRKRHGRYPEYRGALYEVWKDQKPDTRVPHDPFDGDVYGYGTDGRTFWLWSVGPDMKSNTDDDIDFLADEK